MKRPVRVSPDGPPVVVKVEKGMALDNLEAILDVAAAAMVARGDLGVELPFEQVPLAQKRMIQLCNLSSRPVITATQMLESMIHAPRPTRAEASDVANAVLDGTSALMLSGETAIGDYPLESVAYMDRIARAVEPSLDYRHEIPEADDWLWFSMNVFANVYPVWNDSDGGWHEGMAYWRSYLERFSWWADVMYAAMNINAYESLPFFQQVGYLPIYAMPPGTPLDQKVVQYGPFVLTSQEEVYQAFMDYQTHSNGFERANGWESEIGKSMVR